MFHLLNKVYLDFDFNLEYNKESWSLVSEKMTNYPFTTDLIVKMKHKASNYTGLLEHFDNDPQKLLDFIVNYPATSEHVFFVDQSTMAKALILWLKALLPNITQDAAYLIYKLSIDSTKYIESQIDHYSWVFCVQAAGVQAIGKPEFVAMYQEIPKLSMAAHVRNKTSIEWLLATYIHNPTSQYSFEFEERVRRIVWKDVAWEISDLRQNLLRGLLDVHVVLGRHAPVVEFEENLAAQVAGVDPNYRFLFDINVGPDNLAALRARDITIMRDIYQAYCQKIGSRDVVVDKLFEWACRDSIDVAEVIDFDASLNLGTQVFARSEYATSMNALLISYLYRLKRSGSDTIKQFSLLEDTSASN